MLRPYSLTISLTILLCAFMVPAGAKPQVRSDDTSDTLGVLYNNQGISPCDLARDIREQCEPEVNSTVSPTECSCNNVFFNIWSACILVQVSGDLPSFSAWGAGCKNASQDVTDGYMNGLGLGTPIPIWAFMRVPDDDKFNIDYVRRALQTDFTACGGLATRNWSTVQKIAPAISSIATLVLVGFIILLYWSKSTSRDRRPRGTLRRFFPRAVRVHKVRKADRNETWSIDQSEETDEFVIVGQEDAAPHRVQSPTPMSRADYDLGPPLPPKSEWHFPGKAPWKRPIQLPSRFPFLKDRPIPVEAVSRTNRFRINSVDHSTLSGLSGGSVEGGNRSSIVKFSTENYPGGSSRAHETIEEASDEGEDASLISPDARSENHVFLISNRDTFTVGSRTSTSQSASHQVHIQPPTPTASSSYSPVIVKHPMFKPKVPTHIPPPPTKPAPSPPVIPPRVPPQLQKSHSETQLQQPVASTSQLMDIRVPPISQPPLSISPPRPSGPLHTNPQYVLPRRQLSIEEDDPLHQRNSRKPLGARNLTSPASKESLRHENAFSNIQYSAQAHQRQLSDSAIRRSPLHWRDEVHQGGTSPPFVHRELSIEEEISRPTPSHYPGAAGPSSQLPRSPAPIPHRRGHSADDATSSNASMLHPSPYSHTRNLSSEAVPLRSDPINLFPGAVRATGYPNSRATTESSNSLYSDGSYPIQPPNPAHPPHRS
ncbi:hypothetical protein BDZ94DRAFT_1276126 [Collybia nuda]|uniref:Uncharacterized protein n=1 Tax=Collybia nuda TaxID=64659 RepID=A0A9P6CCQ7_9AGAR|nr:hypothetical protein BDZ94DRAFT_1276126 [Collybia nuda]